jgi:hypothetical protein
MRDWLAARRRPESAKQTTIAIAVLFIVGFFIRIYA